ncbi:glycosyltransferase family 2 protein [Psychrobacter namhaensis]|uniref:glycosyltransferase family 2 protein n=1 Tax=Psychrobacter namhaensis TaxID=292734 RepID=UPI003FD05AF6
MTKTDNSSPLVTVYMPTYNRVALLQRAVESVLSQDYSNIELIVVDDNSTDGTHQYLAEMAEKDSRFRYFINEKNSGACVSRNKAIFAANGEYITGLDDDDYFLHNHISSYIKTWNNSRNQFIALYANAYVKVDDTSKIDKYKIRKVKYCSNKDLLSGNWIGNQIFTKTVFLKDIGGFDPAFSAWQDLDCWYRLLNQNRKKAKLSQHYGYVVDKSHPHERISSKKIENIYKTYTLFSKKHRLSTLERKVLKSQVYLYSRKDIHLIDIIKSTFYPFNISNLERRKEYLRRVLMISIKEHLLKFK